MKKIFVSFVCFGAFSTLLHAQINPVSNLTWTHQYVTPNNYFTLDWNEPASPHDELIGYNIYRGNDLYRFQTDGFLANTSFGSNCGEDFLTYGEESSFLAHVTAVYQGGIESDYTETIYVDGLLLRNPGFDDSRARLYPNPTRGIVYVDLDHVDQIAVFDISGQELKTLAGVPEIDLSAFRKGIYIIRLTVGKSVIYRKIVVE